MTPAEKINMCLDDLNIHIIRYNQEIIMSKDQILVNIYRKKIESLEYCKEELIKLKDSLIKESEIIEEEKK